jgi:tRNA threonylcarbamoyladenosine biosynthesis protein TsaE
MLKNQDANLPKSRRANHLFPEEEGFYLCRMERIFSLSAIQPLAREFWSVYAGKKIFCFSGELGAGKTTFIHALCEVKKVADSVSSPTFPIINEYAYPGGTIYHIDLYRIKDEDEAIRAGVEDCLYSGDICLVEWPERARGIFPPGAVQVRMEPVGLSRRKIEASDP